MAGGGGDGGGESVRGEGVGENREELKECTPHCGERQPALGPQGPPPSPLTPFLHPSVSPSRSLSPPGVWTAVGRDRVTGGAGTSSALASRPLTVLGVWLPLPPWLHRKPDQLFSSLPVLHGGSEGGRQAQAVWPPLLRHGCTSGNRPCWAARKTLSTPNSVSVCLRTMC